MSYRILDEPRPGPLSTVAVNPFWPLLGVMLGGAWLSWPWFAVNGFAVGSPTRGRELGVALLGFAGGAVIVLTILQLAGSGVLEGGAVRYAVIALTVWQLAVSYALYALQVRSFHLYEHFGGTVRSGLGVVLLAFVIGRRTVASALAGSWLGLLLL